MSATKPDKKDLRDAREALSRQHILKVAEHLFAEQGFAQTRMQDIAAEAEMSLATLYQQFAGKQKLFRAILIERDQAMMKLVLSKAGNLFSGSANLQPMLTLMGEQIGYLLDHPDYLRLQLQEGRLWFHSDTRPSSEEQQLWQQGQAMMQQMFQWGIEHGLFVADEPEDMARMMLAMQQTRLASWVADQMRKPKAAVIQQIQQDFVRFFCVQEHAPGLSQGRQKYS